MSDQFAYKKSKQLQINELEHEVKTVDGRAAEAHARIDAVVQRVVDLENGDCDFTEALGIIRRRLTALESTVEALKHVRITDIARVTALYNRLAALESYKSETEESIDELDKLTRSLTDRWVDAKDFHQRIRALESAPTDVAGPAAERDDIGVCARCHCHKYEHQGYGWCPTYIPFGSPLPTPEAEPAQPVDPMCGGCGHRRSCHSDGHGCGFGQCYCREFVAPTPEAAPAQPVDPVLMAISGAWKQWHRQSARSLVVGSYLEYAFRSQAGIHESRDITRDLMSYGSSS